MSFSAASIMYRAATTLLDLGSVRWSALELRDYLNEAMREVVTLKPNASTATVELTLVAGTRQTLPATYTVICRALRNKISQTAITSIDNTILLDQQIPGWQSPDVIPYHRNVEHIIPDIIDQDTFLVVPGNDGTGIIEAVVGRWPVPVHIGSDPADILTYTALVPLPDMMQNALVQYVLYRAYSKDAGSPSAAQRAAGHLAMFQNTIAALIQSETGVTLVAESAAKGAKQ